VINVCLIGENGSFYAPYEVDIVTTQVNGTTIINFNGFGFRRVCNYVPSHKYDIIRSLCVDLCPSTTVTMTITDGTYRHILKITPHGSVYLYVAIPDVIMKPWTTIYPINRNIMAVTQRENRILRTYWTNIGGESAMIIDTYGSNYV
jgi:hypothetical protein